jgi:AraC family transcriptional regulator
MLQPTQPPYRARAYRASTLTSYALAVERVIQAMRAHLSEPLALEEMAEIACLSPFHFNRMFRSLTGIPPGEFLTTLRLDAAKRLLLTTSLSVTDICFGLGYTSPGSFTTRFKQMVGLAPLQLRQVADALANTALAPLATDARRAQDLADDHTHGVSGSITVPGPFAGLIFAGLFPRPIPQNRPVACVTLAAPGHYLLGPVPDGRYYLLGAALPWSPHALTYLLPETGLLVGVAELPVLVRGGRTSRPVDLALRPRHVADPPILGVFPPLLASPAAARARMAL